MSTDDFAFGARRLSGLQPKEQPLISVLLQTTIAPDADDWSIERFGLLRQFLSGSRGSDGRPLFNVIARDRGPVGRPDPVLSALHGSAFDELWLLAVGTEEGLMPEDCEGIRRFRQRGGGLMLTCDRRAPAAATRRPAYHSGVNGDYQSVRVVGEPHAVLHDPLAPGGFVRYLPAHPHEGMVMAPDNEPGARVILRGHSFASGADFNLAVAIERSAERGPAIAQSSFRHFCDYNWNLAKGAPSFVNDVPGDGLEHFPEAVRSTQQYVRNVALWLAGRSPFFAPSLTGDRP
ncbi:hypothetical protein [Aquabacterium sp.]|uniref:hypothetical protein n=1 Tax=Aquabacterium sp. TaxID=1872578 RepID=UPI002C1BBC44|nr:hypothetical protein [Aquabacterium sp.]HSW04113.1 hypothetical protein [Aquabacterium sp.]